MRRTVLRVALVVWVACEALAGVPPRWAGAQEGGFPALLLIDQSDAEGALSLEPESQLTVRHGDLVVNSSHASAVLCNGSRVQVDTGAVRVCGGARATGAGGLVPGAVKQERPAPDPCAPLVVPDVPQVVSMERVTLPEGKASVLLPGTYIGGIVAAGQAKVTMLPGAYVIRDGDFLVNHATLQGSGVTIVMAGENPGRFSVSYGEDLRLTAPNTGKLKDALIVSRGPAVTFEYSKGSLVGRIYAPKALPDVTNS